MRRPVHTLVLLLFSGQLAALALGAEKQKPTPKQPAAVGDLIVGQPIRHDNLTIFPLMSPQPKTEDRFITLDQGLREGSVKITEVAGGTVNRLLVLNRATRPLYLMPGEIIVGGRQDRTIAQEYVINPGKKPVSIEVFCVEHGRWSGRGQDETARLMAGANSAPALAESNAFTARRGGAATAGKAETGDFIGSVGAVNKAARIAVQDDKSQDKVWQKVAEVNAKSSNASGSGDFAGNYSDAAVVKQLEPYVKTLQTSVGDRPQIVGVAVAVNGKFETLDVFESTPLFRQLWPKLLKSYALDAANAASDSSKTNKSSTDSRSTSPQTCDAEDVRRLLYEANAVRGKESTNGDLAVTTASTDHLLVFSTQDSRRPVSGRARSGQSAAGLGGLGGGGLGGGFGGGIHGSGFAK